MKPFRISVIKAADMLQKLQREGYSGIIYAEFFKRGDDPVNHPGGTNEIRKMRFRFGVHKFDKGGFLKFDPAGRALISVCDMALIPWIGKEKNGKYIRSAYRFVTLNALIRMRIEGVEYIVRENQYGTDQSTKD